MSPLSVLLILLFLVLTRIYVSADDYDTIRASNHTCFNNKYYNKSTIFNAPKNGTVNGVKLQYLNDSISCSSMYECQFQAFLLHLTNASQYFGEIYYPSNITQNVTINTTNDVECNRGCIYSSYTMTITNHNNYTLLYPTYSVSTNDEFMLQDSQACCSDSVINITQSDNTCVAIYFLYTKERTKIPTTEPTIKVSEYGVDVTVTYDLPHTQPNDKSITKTITDITKDIVIGHLPTVSNKTNCITDKHQHISNSTFKILIIQYVVRICDKNLQLTLQNFYKENLKPLLLEKINDAYATQINITLNDIHVTTILTDTHEGLNPTPYPTISMTVVETTRNNNIIHDKHNSSPNTKVILYVIIGVIFIFGFVGIILYQKRREIAVKFNMKELNAGLLSAYGETEYEMEYGHGHNSNSSTDLLRCDTLSPLDKPIFADKHMSKDSFELFAGGPGSVKLSIIASDLQPQKDGFYVRAITDYNNNNNNIDNDEQLSFNENAIFWVIQTTESGWWYAINEMGEDGWIPSNYVIKLDKNERKELRQQQKKQTDGENYIALLTEPMDKSYNNLKNNNSFILDNVPQIIAPPMHITDDGNTNDIMSSDSSSSEQLFDLHKTVGSVTKNDEQ